MKVCLYENDERIEVEIDESSAGVSIRLGEDRCDLEHVASFEGGGAIRWAGRTLRYLVGRSGSRVRISIGGETFELDTAAPTNRGRGRRGGEDPETRAPMPGTVIEVRVRVGEAVDAGTPLLVLEAMKMENVLNAEVTGTVAEVNVAPGDRVEPGQTLVRIEAS